MTRRLVQKASALYRGTAGTNLVEAAIITPLLLLLTFSIVDFSSIFYVYLALENGVSQATRFAITGNTITDPNNPSQQLSRTESIKLTMRQATPTLTIPDGAFSFQYMSPGSSTWVAGVGGVDAIQKVTIDYNWSIMTPLIRPFFTGGSIHFTVDSAMKNEGRFQ